MRLFRPFLLAAALGALPSACTGDGDDAAQDTSPAETEDSAALQPGPCGRIVDCASETDRPVTRLIAQYGDDGTCWDDFPKEACWQDCRAILSVAACGMTDQCCECETEADCDYDPERPLCLAGSCAAEIGGSDTDNSDTDGPIVMGGGDFGPTDFLVLLSLSVDPQTPIQLTGSVHSEAGTLSFDLQYLALDVGSDSTPRSPTGQFLREEVPVADDGTFELTVDNASVVGAANPVNGSDIVMSFSVAGQVSPERICGALAGTVTVPTDINLSGSAFSGIPAGDGALPAATEATCG